MKEHLEIIAVMIKNFIIDEKKFSKIYIQISGHVTANHHYRFEIDSDCEAFTSLTIKESRDIGKELHDKIRTYLEKNEIKKTIIVNTLFEPEFGYTRGISVEYKEKFDMRF